MKKIISLILIIVLIITLTLYYLISSGLLFKNWEKILSVVRIILFIIRASLPKEEKQFNIGEHQEFK